MYLFICESFLLSKVCPEPLVGLFQHPFYSALQSLNVFLVNTLLLTCLHTGRHTEMTQMKLTVYQGGENTLHHKKGWETFCYLNEVHVRCGQPLGPIIQEVVHLDPVVGLLHVLMNQNHTKQETDPKWAEAYTVHWTKIYLNAGGVPCTAIIVFP